MLACAMRPAIGSTIQAARGAFGAINETVFRFMRDRLQAWIGRETAEGRQPGPQDIAARRAEIVATFNRVRTRCAEIQADVVAKKKQAIDAGGLYVLGTERHESRRIDNQLRGRSGRQGDPGRSKFYLSLEDDLMRIFGSGRMDGVLQKLGLQEGEAITHPWINKALEKAQQKVEARNFDSRKYVLKYDDVMNDQRKVIFEQRIDMMGHDDVSETVADMRAQVVNELVAQCIPPNAYAEQWDTATLKTEVERIFGIDVPVEAWAAEEGIAEQEITERLLKDIDDKAKQKEAEFGPEATRQIEKMVLLQTLDHLWREHLIVHGAFAQRDRLPQLRPARSAQRVQVRKLPAVRDHARQHARSRHRPAHAPAEDARRARGSVRAGGAAADAGAPRRSLHRAGRARHGGRGAGGRRASGRRGQRSGVRLCRRRRASMSLNPSDPATWGKVARNAACPCGSGKKYKHCHGKHD